MTERISKLVISMTWQTDLIIAIGAILLLLLVLLVLLRIMGAASKSRVERSKHSEKSECLAVAPTTSIECAQQCERDPPPTTRSTKIENQTTPLPEKKADTAPTSESQPLSLAAGSAAASRGERRLPPAAKNRQRPRDDIASLSDGSPVTVKFNLARAYMDLGEVKEATQLFKEIVKEGSATQQQMATALLKKLENDKELV